MPCRGLLQNGLLRLSVEVFDLLLFDLDGDQRRHLGEVAVLPRVAQDLEEQRLDVFLVLGRLGDGVQEPLDLLMGDIRQVFLAEQRVDPEIDIGAVASPGGKLDGRFLIFEPLPRVVAGM
jgi:hypothetical protein